MTTQQQAREALRNIAYEPRGKGIKSELHSEDVETLAAFVTQHPDATPGEVSMPTMRVSLERTDWGSYVQWHVDCAGRRHAPPMRYAATEKDRTLLECTACHQRAWMAHGTGLGEYCLPVEPVHTPPPQIATEADAYLAALLRYSGDFYAAAIEAGMSAGIAANAVAHVERAARSLHRLTAAPPAPVFASPSDMHKHIADVGKKVDAPTADAVLAEREACAMEADYEAARWEYSPEINGPCKSIAAAIRNRRIK